MFKVTFHIIKLDCYQIAYKDYIINGTITQHYDDILRQKTPSEIACEYFITLIVVNAIFFRRNHIIFFC